MTRLLPVILILLLLTGEALARNKGLVWVGLGEAEGKYEEDEYSLSGEVRGSTYEYQEFRYFEQKNQRSVIPYSTGVTKGFFVHYTLFDPDFEDEQDRKHSLSFTEIIPHWSRGYQHTLHLTKKLDWLNSAELFLGIGFIAFEKEIENLHKFEYKWGYDLSYGYAMNSMFKYDDNWFFGWRSLVKNNRITLEYNENQGYLTHRRDILFFIGTTFKGSSPSCVSTQYVKCS